MGDRKTDRALKFQPPIRVRTSNPEIEVEPTAVFRINVD